MTISGGCECGSVIYEMEGGPKATVVCHCSSCQTQSGSAFGLSMVLASDQFRLVQGELRFFDRPAASGTTMRCYFCHNCGTRIYHQKLNAPDIVILKPGTLYDTMSVRPTRQLWTCNKQPWIDLPELSAFEKQPS